MKGTKIITILIIINLILMGTIYNLINKVNVNNQKQIIKEMTETEYEDNITELNQSHEDYAKHIEESKKKIASAITEMGVSTSYEETLENMANNIKSIARNNNLLISETAMKTDYITITVPEGVNNGILVSVCSAGTNFSALHDITGEGIIDSEVLFEHRIRLANGVTTAVRILKCTFSPQNIIKSGWDNTVENLNSHFIFILG